MHGEELKPGESLSLKFVLTKTNEPLRVGIWYYTGKFKDGNDLLSKLGIPIQNDSGILAKMKYLWASLTRRFSKPHYHEVWCGQTISYGGGKSTNSVIRQ